jgi:peptidoglycan/LPS O-acetylase OafA/YrhL
MNKQPNERLFFLDFLRVISTLVIILFHSMTSLSFFDFAKFSKQYSFLGQFSNLAVSIFFIVSGFSLAYSYKKRFKENTDIKFFYLNRIKRIFPLYFTTLLFFLVVNTLTGLIPQKSSFLSYLTTFLGINGFLTSFFNLRSILGIRVIVNIGEWFLGLIFLYYLIFPILFKTYIKYRDWLVFLFTLIISLLSMFYFSEQIMLKRFPLSRLFEFSSGMFLAIKYQKNKTKFNLLNSFSLLIFFIFTYLYRFNFHSHDLFNTWLNNLKLILPGVFLFSSGLLIPLKISGAFNRVLIFLSNYSLGIFFAHHQIINNLKALKLFDLLKINQNFPLSFLMILALSILVGIILTRISKIVYKLMF